ncbi:MAG: hypothetical protein JNL74_15065 [Fibrobacteres bacterium]|nr:hypothetical protein [Fibrobacterota bacterium]
MINNSTKCFLDRTPEQGEIRNWLIQNKVKIVVGHPTFQNHDNINKLLHSDIDAINKTYPDVSVAIIISDGSSDKKTITACEEAASGTNVKIFAAPYDGYKGRSIPGKGSALRLIFEEIENTPVDTLILLDGDLKNNFTEWFSAYRKILNEHKQNYPGKEAFITARYARHFVDASITRNVVGPLTTLLGTYVPGGISGDIVLTAGAAALELKSEWTEARCRYGTDIATTFDNIGNGTVIYEAYLGAKLHDITDDAKLTVMPGEVIGSALERLLSFEKADGRVSRIIKDKTFELKNPICYGPEKTGIKFINPGRTAAFSLAKKRESLVSRFPAFESDLKRALPAASFQKIKTNVSLLESAFKNGSDSPLFISVTPAYWCSLLYESLSYFFKTLDIDTAKKAMNYLYTAAFLETCAERLSELGLRTAKQIETVEKNLGVDDNKAYDFYTNNVDGASLKLATEFFKGRESIKWQSR